MNWIETQEKSSEILYSGIYYLINSEKNKLKNLPSSFSGIFLISNGIMKYINYADNIEKLKKIEREKESSYFFRTYKELKSYNPLTPENLSYEDFEIQLLEENFATRELVEFGIEQIPCFLQPQLHKKLGLQIGGEYIEKALPENINGKLWLETLKLKEIIFEEGFNYLENLKPSKLTSLTNDIDLNKIEYLNSTNTFSFPGILIIEHPEYGVFHIQESYKMADVYMNIISNNFFKSPALNKIYTILNIDKVNYPHKRIMIGRDLNKEKISKFKMDMKVKFLPVKIGRVEFAEFIRNKYKSQQKYFC